MMEGIIWLIHHVSMLSLASSISKVLLLLAEPPVLLRDSAMRIMRHRRKKIDAAISNYRYILFLICD